MDQAEYGFISPAESRFRYQGSDQTPVGPWYCECDPVPENPAAPNHAGHCPLRGLTTEER